MGHEGSYLALKPLLREVSPPVRTQFKPWFETPPGQQAQMVFAAFSVAFTDEPVVTRKVWLFSSDEPSMPVGEQSINQIRCRSAIYNLTEIWVERSNQGSLKPIQLTKPILSSSHVVGLKTGNGLMNAAFDPDTNEISNDEKWVGHGDQSEGGRWTIEDGRLFFHL